MLNSESCRIAAIDIGSNSIHLVVARCSEDGNMHILDSDKVNLRLGDALDEHMYFSRNTVHKMIETILHMKEIADVHKPVYRAVATHAMRMARNHDDVITKIYEKTGIQIDLIDGLEEARLASLGMMYGLPIGDEIFLGVDIGGGSTEIIIRDKTQVYFVTSLQLGAVTLTKKFLSFEHLKKEHVYEMINYVALCLAPIMQDAKRVSFKKSVACSGTAKALACMDDSSQSQQNLKDHPFVSNGYVLSNHALEKIFGKLSQYLKPSRIKSEWNLDQNRSDIILAGCAILHQISIAFEIEEWTVSGFSLREGVVIDTLSRLYKEKHFPFLDENLRWKRILQFGRQMQIDEVHAKQVSDLSMRLYDQLFPLWTSKELDETLFSNRDLLQAASWLHESGKFINFSRYHKHSYYLITQGRILGLSQKEQALIGLVVKYHRKSQMDSKKRDISFLIESDIKRIHFLSTVLRLATAAHRTRQYLIRDIVVSKVHKKIILALIPKFQTIKEVDRLKLIHEVEIMEDILDLPIEVMVPGS